MRNLPPPSAQFPNPLRKLAAVVATVAVLGLALMFSVVLIAVMLVVGTIAGGYFWWKTRELRKGSADLFGERDEAQGARRAESETYHGDRRAFEHRATQRFARAANKSALPKQMRNYSPQGTVMEEAMVEVERDVIRGEIIEGEVIVVDDIRAEK